MLFAWQMLLLAQNGGDANQGPGANPLLTFVPWIIIFAVFYFFVIRMPMKRQEQERHTLLSALKKNDRVLTAGGIIGIVAAVKDKEDEVTLKVDESSNVRIRVTKASISKILSSEEGAKDQKDGGA